MIYLIVGCEISFWVILLVGLIVRYIVGNKRIGGLILLAVPLVDVTLLIASAIHLASGGTVQYGDALAPIYLGVTIAWGADMINWADRRFAYRFAGGPKPEPKPKVGTARARFEAYHLKKHVFAWAIGCCLLGGGILLVGDLGRADPLSSIALKWTFVLLIDIVWSSIIMLQNRRRSSLQ